MGGRELALFYFPAGVINKTEKHYHDKYRKMRKHQPVVGSHESLSVGRVNKALKNQLRKSCTVIFLGYKLYHFFLISTFTKQTGISRTIRKFILASFKKGGKRKIHKTALGPL